METTVETTAQTKGQKASHFSTGLAMFAMFFGAGNIVFPLAMGQIAQDKNAFGITGLLITAVFVPLTGLLAMLLFEGDFQSFFKRVGKVPGYLIMLLILGLIGPFGGIPRCMTISHSTLHACGLEDLSLPLFALVSCVAIFLFTFRPSKLLPLLGFVLTPLLLLSLFVIIMKGLWGIPPTTATLQTRWEVFSKGVLEGYNTMDLLASFFFSSVVLVSLRNGQAADKIPLNENKRLLNIAIFGSLLAACLLTTIYVCFSFLSSGYSNTLPDVPNHQLLGALAYHILGPYAGMVAGAVVSFACLTTEIALTAVFAGFLHKNLFKEKGSYTFFVLVTLVLAFIVSSLHFEGISAFIVPILQLFYPALIVLSVANLLNKLYGFQPVKRFFYGTIALTLAVQLLL
ncbi:MAG: Branched-chain amino acid transport system 2 carrier protein [Chlamydiae bacterium]|nr:Branched-chain amino acid transport system 2 carrier protein [Chlamydiota bacterium]